MPERLLIDSDVAIDYLRGQPHALSYIDNSLDDLMISAVSVAELYAGYKGASEKLKLDSFIGAMQVVAVEHLEAMRGGEYRNLYGKSHGTDLNDAINAAIAESQAARVVRLNVKHYPMLKNVVVPYRKP